MDGPDLPAAIRACFRVLRPGGSLCFSVLHPCFITPALRWGPTDGEGATDPRHLRVGRYFEKDPSWNVGVSADVLTRPHPHACDEPFEVPRFPRTLSGYVNAISEAGFRIVKMEEPRPSEERARAHAWLNRWYQHAPLVLFLLRCQSITPSSLEAGGHKNSGDGSHRYLESNEFAHSYSAACR